MISQRIFVNETWREYVERQAAARYGDDVAHVCVHSFDRLVANGEPEDIAAWSALFEWTAEW